MKPEYDPWIRSPFASQRSHPFASVRSGGEIDHTLEGTDQSAPDGAPLDLALSNALEVCDEPAIWRQYRQAPDKGLFLDRLSYLAGRCSIEQRHRRSESTLWHHALFAVPFLLPPEGWPDVRSVSIDQKTASAVCAQLQAWLGYKQPVRVLGEAVKYESLCNWSPLLQREYLQALAWFRTSCARPAEPLRADLPPDWPQLAFVIGSVQRWNCPPELARSARNTDSEWELRARLAVHFDYTHQRPMNGTHVLAPLFFPEAVLAGLQLWIGDLCRRGLVSGWDVHIYIEDYVVLELTHAGDEAAKTSLPIRLHHMGSRGFEKLLHGLEKNAGSPLHRTRSHA